MIKRLGLEYPISNIEQPMIKERPKAQERPQAGRNADRVGRKVGCADRNAHGVRRNARKRAGMRFAQEINQVAQERNPPPRGVRGKKAGETPVP